MNAGSTKVRWTLTLFGSSVWLPWRTSPIYLNYRRPLIIWSLVRARLALHVHWLSSSLASILSSISTLGFYLPLLDLNLLLANTVPNDTYTVLNADRTRMFKCLLLCSEATCCTVCFLGGKPVMNRCWRFRVGIFSILARTTFRLSLLLMWCLNEGTICRRRISDDVSVILSGAVPPTI